jgi:HAD superfamily hydrolase (TIGR01509 family)
VTVRGIVFDLDGTLVDSFGAIAESVNAARTALGLPELETKEITRHVGRGLHLLLADVVGPSLVDRAVPLYREAHERIYLERTKPLPGALDAVRRLHAAGIRLSVASNKLSNFSRGILDHLGFSPYLTTVEGPDTAGAVKPDPAMIRRCLSVMGVDPSEAIYVGDMPLDVESARRAGVPVVLVATGAASAQTLAATGAPLLTRLVDLDTAGPGRSGTR